MMICKGFITMKIKIILISILLLFIPKYIHAQSDSSNIVTGVGIGKDQDEAKKQAFRNAIENAIGTFINSESLTNNYRLIDDEILTYSSGYISNYEILNTTKLNNNLIEIQIRAEVYKNVVKNKLKELKLNKVEVDGGSLFAEAFTQTEMKKDASLLLKNFFIDYPEDFYIVKVSEPIVLDTDLQKNQALIEYKLRIEWNLEKFQKMIDIFKIIDNDFPPEYKIYITDNYEKTNKRLIAKFSKDIIDELNDVNSPLKKQVQMIYGSKHKVDHAYNSCRFEILFIGKYEKNVHKESHSINIAYLGLDFYHIKGLHPTNELVILSPKAESKPLKFKEKRYQKMNCEMTFEFWLDIELLQQIKRVETYIFPRITF